MTTQFNSTDKEPTMKATENDRWYVKLLDRWWGKRFYVYEAIEEDVLLIEINQFQGDEYMVEFQVQHVTQARRGPWFAPRFKDRGYIAEWSIPKDGAPILLDRTVASYGSYVSITDPVDWRMDADDALKAWVIEKREEADFQPFDEVPKNSITPIFDSMQWRLLGLAEAGRMASAPLKKFVVDFEELLKKDGGIFITPENAGMNITPLYNETLKAQYTPAELAQQAINRDADPRTFFEQVADVQEIVDKANRKEDQP